MRTYKIVALLASVSLILACNFPMFSPASQSAITHPHYRRCHSSRYGHLGAANLYSRPNDNSDGNHCAYAERPSGVADICGRQLPFRSGRQLSVRQFRGSRRDRPDRRSERQLELVVCS